MRQLGRELINQYDLNIKRYQYIRSSYYLDTNKGRFILRKVELTKEQITFCYEMGIHLQENNFELLCSIYLTKKKLPYAAMGEELYVMHHYMPSDETDFKDEADLTAIICTLAQFHKAAVGVKASSNDVHHAKIKNIYEYYMKRQSENSKLRKSMLGLKQKSNFELMFLEQSKAYTELEQLALRSINKELAERLIQDVIEDKKVAHRDFTYHTVSKTEDSKYIIENIDMCNYDIQVLDLAQILSKMMQKNEWSQQLLYKLISTYVKERNLSSDEMQMLKFMIIYPEKYNSICFKYISSKRRWNYSMFEQKWQNMLSYKENQIDTAKAIQSW